MKTSTTILLLLCSYYLSAQVAFRQAMTMQDIRPVESEVVAAYQDAGLIYGEIANQIRVTNRFMEEPFDPEIDYIDINLLSLNFLHQIIEENKARKDAFQAENYDILRACQPDLPEYYTQFLNDDALIFTDDMQNCFENEMFQDDGEFEAMEEIVMEELELSRDFSVSNPVVRSESKAAPTPSAGLTPVSFATSVVDATSQFLVERVKEELLLAFFDQFFTKIDQSPELTALLPNTRTLLNKQDIFRVPSMGKVWTTAFQEDLNNFNANLSELILTHPNYTDTRDDVATQLFLVAGYSHEQFRKGTPALQVFDGIQKRFGRERNEIGIALALTDLFIDNLIVPEQNDLMEIDTFLQLSENGGKASLYFSGLLYQQNQILFESVKINGNPLSKTIEQNHLRFTDKLTSLLRISAQMKSSREEFAQTIPNKKDEPDAYRRAFYRYIDNFLRFVDFGFDIWYFNTPQALYQSDYQQLYRPITHNTIRALQAEIEQDYASVILHTLQVIAPIVQTRIRATKRKIEQLQDNKGSSEKIKKLARDTLIARELVRNLTHYGGFMVDVLSADNAANIKGIIYKYAAPVRSYRVKRQSPFSVSLSAYPGLQTGYERILNSDKYSLVTGITAPIGPSLNWGKNKHSFSLFVPVIDIGATFSYRWQNEAEGFPADIKWEQILSPGAYLAWGIPKAPIAILAGAQYTPKLRKIGETEIDIQQNALRFGLSTTIDIPIFHFYRSKK